MGESFFLRMSQDSNGATYAEGSEDLGSYINLGPKSSTGLRIKNIAVSILDHDNPSTPLISSADTAVYWQLTTSTQSASVYPTDKSVVASGVLQLGFSQLGFSGGSGKNNYLSEHADVLPQHWTNGYLIAVDTLYLGVDCGVAFTDDVKVCIVMECEQVKITQANATALALSQT